jgi:hypothetical protein
MKTATTCLLLILLALPLGACVVAAGAVGGVAAAKYMQNQEARSYRTTLRAAYEAALAALPELGYPAASQATLGPTEARVQAGDAKIAMAQFPGGVVRIAVSVGTFETDDHRRRAALVHERLATRLGAATAP